MDDLDVTFAAYLECALWSSTDEEDVPLDSGEREVDPDALAAMRADVNAFVADHPVDLAGLDPEQIGHDLWLTRNHHGAGYWDRGLGAVGDRLTTAAHALGEQHLYVGDDGLVYMERG